MSWRAAARRDFPALADFLREREYAACPLTSRLLSFGRLKPPGPGGDSLFSRMEGGRCLGLVLLSPQGFCFSLLGSAPVQDDASLAALIQAARLPAVLMSDPAEGRRLEEALGRPALEERINRFFIHEGEPLQASLPPGFSVRRAGRADLEGLMPIQEAYEREEVLPSIHGFDPRACRATLQSSLERQLVVVAVAEGEILGKAQTNARGELWEQIGGIFVRQDARGRGLAPAMLAALRALLWGQGRRRHALFVREANLAARRAYLKAGFRPSEALLRIAYHS